MYKLVRFYLIYHKLFILQGGVSDRGVLFGYLPCAHIYEIINEVCVILSMYIFIVVTLFIFVLFYRYR